MSEITCCPQCRTSLTHITGAHYRCSHCEADYGVFRKQAPYTGVRCVRLKTTAQVRMAEEKKGEGEK